MSVPRPYIPLSVCVQVAERQLEAKGGVLWLIYCHAQQISPWSLGRRLRVLLDGLFGDKHYQLDHDPALVLRKFRQDHRKPKAAWFSPNANNPDFLVYRSTTDHLQKTTGRKPGAERTVTTKGSDIGLKTKFARLARRKVDTSDIPEAKKSWFKKAKVKIPSRKFSTQKRKIR